MSLHPIDRIESRGRNERLRCLRCSCSRGHSLLSDLWVTNRTQGMRLQICSRKAGVGRCDAIVWGHRIKEDGYECRGALTYLAGFVTGFIFLVLEPNKSNSFVRFHAFQSIFFNVAWVVFWIVWMVLSAALTPLTAGAFGFIALPLTVIVTLAGFGMWVFLMYEAYQQRLFRLPIVGRFAADRAGVRL